MDAEALAESNLAFNVAVLHETFPGDFEPNYHEEISGSRYRSKSIIHGCAFPSVV